MSKTMRLSLTGARRREHLIVHCVDERGDHESGYNLFIMESSKSYALRPVTGVGRDGGFKVTNPITEPVVKLT